MTDKKQPEALELASAAESADLAGHPTAKKANAYYLCLLEDCAHMIRRLHAENTTLQAGYAAARLEIESLRTRSAEPAGEYPALPKFNAGAVATEASGKVEMYPAAFKQLLSEIFDRGAREAAGAWRAYVDADRAMRAAQPAPLTPHADSQPAPDEILNMAREQGLPDKGLTPELTAALQRGADGVFDLLKDWHLINKDAKAGRRLWQIGRNLEGIFGCALRGDYTRASHGQAPAQAAPAAVAGPGAPGMQDAIRQYTEAQDALDNREYAGINAEPYDKLLRARNAARRDLEAAIDAAPTTQPVPQQEAQEPVAWYVTGCGRLLDEYDAEAEARRIGGTAKAMPLYTVPQPSPASQGDALDAARYRWLRDSTEWEPFDSAWLNKHDIYGCPTPAMDAAIDAAIAAQEGK